MGETMDLTLLKQQNNTFSQQQKPYQTLKHIAEWLFCLLTLPLSGPIMLLGALWVRFDSPGPVLFKQDRVGKDGKIFKIYKFRTMFHNHDTRKDAEFMRAFIEHGAVATVKEAHTEILPHTHKDRFNSMFGNHKQSPAPVVFKPFRASALTRAGHFLRKTSLDELPQIFNVLRGNMSIIGPRPNVTYEVDAYAPQHYKRLEVLPGITGLAQVSGRSHISFEAIVKHDLEYIQNENLWLDLKILWRTVSTVLLAKGVA